MSFSVSGAWNRRARVVALAGVVTALLLGGASPSRAAAPTVTLAAPAGVPTDNTPTFSGTAGDAAGDDATVNVAVTGPGGTQNLSAARSGTSFSVTSPTLADGSYTAIATQTNTTEPTGTSPSVAFTIDANGPTVTLGAPASPSSNRTPTFSGSAGNATGDAATVTVSVTGPGGAQNLTATRSGTSFSAAVPAGSALPDGSYTAVAKQTDNAGHTGTSPSVSFTIDGTAPAVALTSPAGGSSSTQPKPTFAGTAGSATGDAATVDVDLYAGGAPSGTPMALHATRTGGTFAVTVTTALSIGTYTAVARQTDTAGNVGTSTAVTFAIVPVPSGGGGGGGRGAADAAESPPSPAGASTPTVPAPSGLPQVGTKQAPVPTAAVPKKGDPRVVKALGGTLGWAPTVADFLRFGGTALSFTAPMAGRVTITWRYETGTGKRARKVLVAQGSRKAPRGKLVKVAITATPAGRQLLRRLKGTVDIAATATFQPRKGKPVRISTTLKLAPS